ncbi:hypothetical protein SCA6_012322 [Theobroma cacao]
MMSQVDICRSISSSASSLGSEQNDEEDDEYDDMENGRYQTHKDESPSIVVEQECRFGHLWRVYLNPFVHT